MAMDAREVERMYVREVYEQLAAQQRYLADPRSSRHRRQPWPNVREFLRRQPANALLLDVGCGRLDYEIADCFRIGVDSCSEALLQSAYSPRHDVVLADGINLPFRRGCADAALCVSVLHHLPLAERRVRLLRTLADAMAAGASLLLYVWAAEQPNAVFPAQDVLVPWSFHEIPKNGLMPLIPYQKDSTREQRIIRNSIPLAILEDSDRPSAWLAQLLARVQRRLCRIERRIPAAVPHFLKVEGITKILTGINKWSPLLGNRLRLAMQSVEELYAAELSATLTAEALAVALSALQEITYYRYYHVFRRGELEALVGRCPTVRLRHIQYDSANWCAIVERRPN